MPMRLVLIIEETPWFFGYHVAVSEVDDTGQRTPVMSRDGTHVKSEADGFEGLLEAVRAIL